MERSPQRSTLSDDEAAACPLPPTPAAPSGRPTPVGRVLRAIPAVASFLGTERGQAARHWIALRTGRRVHYTFTRFVRSPAQLDALCGPVLDHVLGSARTGTLRIVVLGCSIGAEPYTIASTLLHRCPGLSATIDAYDVLDSVLDRAREGRYTAREVLGSVDADAAFVAGTFEREGDSYRVRPEMLRRVTFARADVLDRNLAAHIGTADIVFAQNLLMNLSRTKARRAFTNIAALLRPRAALFIDGMDLDLRGRCTKRAQLIPLDYRVLEIHEEARSIRGGRYPEDYSGLPPYRPGPDATRRFCTIFLSASGSR